MCKLGNSRCAIRKFVKHVRNNFADEREDETYIHRRVKWIRGGLPRRRRTGDISSLDERDLIPSYNDGDTRDVDLLPPLSRVQRELRVARDLT